MKVKPKAVNRYSKWQYLVLIFTIFMLFLSALPNIFGQNAALNIRGSSDSMMPASQVYQLLQEQNVAVKQIDINSSELTVLLNDNSQQAKAQKVLQQALGHNITVAMSMHSASPAWLKSLGLEPIKLGLDLRGGVQFLLNVDTDQAVANKLTQMQQEIRTLLRESHIRNSSVLINGLESIEIKLPAVSSQAKTSLKNKLAELYPNLKTAVHSGGDISVIIPETEQHLIRQLTLQENLHTLRGRIEALGITEAVTQRQGQNRIRIELPGVQDPAEAKRVIGATASLEFYPVLAGGGRLIKTARGETISIARLPILTGQHISDARSGRDEFGSAQVSLTLDASGGKLMSNFTRANIGKPMATLYTEYRQDQDGNLIKEGKIINVATIRAHLGSRFQISGMEDSKAAQELALLLRAGSLSAPVSIIEERTIGPSLGQDNIENGFAALLLGLSAIVTFMALWYRRLGWIANLSLLTNLVMLIGLMSLLPGAVLTLPGIAGLVLTIGMAVDTNVLIFERIKEESKRGRSLAMAVEAGYRGALTTIMDANITTMICAVVLFSIGYGPVKGFAVTLGLGILTSIFTGVFTSRALVNLTLLRKKKTSRKHVLQGAK
ncbi:protein translocase subunit SecD [Psychromonas ossibalaenae]|uniref:protein translocase subunit SecD n=1 Tax=Psychromonas ossibalaenae TaxID=444922 RepID=UPI0003791D69|nr:protein translocase subunit SecD [Psychromonas ossibalaenae]